MLLLISTIILVTVVLFMFISAYMLIEQAILRNMKTSLSSRTYGYIYKTYIFIGILGFLFTLSIIGFGIRLGEPSWREWSLDSYSSILQRQIKGWTIYFSFSFPMLSLLARRIAKKEIIEQRNIIKEASIAAVIILAIIGLAAPLFVS